VMGAHVQLTEGEYTGQTGTIVAFEEEQQHSQRPRAIVLTDMTHKQVVMGLSQLRECHEIFSQDSLQGYQLYDFVYLDGPAKEVGVIVHVGFAEVSIINQHGLVRLVEPEEIRGKRRVTPQRFTARDARGYILRAGASVTVQMGLHKEMTAMIKHINGSVLFLSSPTRSENAGIIVARSRICVLAGTKPNASRAGPPVRPPPIIGKVLFVHVVVESSRQMAFP